MTNTGRVRVKKAIIVPTMSAKGWEYVSVELADWLLASIKNQICSQFIGSFSLGCESDISILATF